MAYLLKNEIAGEVGWVLALCVDLFFQFVNVGGAWNNDAERLSLRLEKAPYFLVRIVGRHSCLWMHNGSEGSWGMKQIEGIHWSDSTGLFEYQSPNMILA